MIKKVPVLLDTDIGNDIDDAVCLAYLLAQSRCRLMGITTVSGQSEKRAAMASVLCKIARQDVPIIPGSEKCLIVPQKQRSAPQAKSLKRWEHATRFPNVDAVTFMRQTIRKNPGKITLLAIGPLTNVALLFALDPAIPKMLNSLVLMCGSFLPGMQKRAPREWNALVDPHATAMVYHAPVKQHRSIGYEVTLKVQMQKEEVLKRFKHPLLEPVVDFAQYWFKQRPVITFHDPLAAATIFDPGICVFRPGTVDIELSDPALLGQTKWNPRLKSKRHRIAVKVNPERFFKHYFNVFD